MAFFIRLELALSSRRGRGLFYPTLTAHTILGVFLKKKAVCDGISKAFKYLLNMADMKSVVVYGKGKKDANSEPEPHSWNIVKISGKSCHIDLTWNLNSCLNGRPSYDYYCLTDDRIKIDHYDFASVPECQSSEMDYFISNGFVIDNIYALHRYIYGIPKQMPFSVYVRLNYSCDLKKELDKAKNAVSSIALGIKPCLVMTTSMNERQGTIRIYAE